MMEQPLHIKKLVTMTKPTCKARESSNRVLSLENQKQCSQLDQLCNTYEKLILDDRRLDKLNIETVKTKFDAEHDHAQRNKLAQSQSLKTALDTQVHLRGQRDLDERERAKNYATLQDKIFEDECRQIVHPKMYALPDYQLTRLQRHRQAENSRHLQQQIQLRRMQTEQEKELRRAEFNRCARAYEAKTRAREDAQADANLEMRQQLVASLNEMKQSQQAQKIISAESRALENDIVFGPGATVSKELRKNSTPKAHPGNIFLFKHKGDRDRARIHDSAPSIGPKPQGDASSQTTIHKEHAAAANFKDEKAWVTSYTAQYQDPRIADEQRALMRQSITNQQLEKQSARHVASQNLEQNQPVAASQAEPAVEEEQLEEADELSEQQSQTSTPDREHSPDVGTVRTGSPGVDVRSQKSVALLSRTSLAHLSKSASQCARSTCTTEKRPSLFSRHKEIFVNRSQVSAAANQRTNRSLEKQAKLFLGDTASLSSSVVLRKGIKDTIKKQIGAPRQFIDKKLYSLAQGEAQKLAIDRLIGKVQSEVLQDKRIAEERRSIDQEEQRIEQVRYDNEKMRGEINKHVLVEQMIAKKRAEEETRHACQSVPHISGNQGYPPRYQLSQDQVRLQERSNQVHLQKHLQEQMLCKANKERADRARETSLDRDYLEEFNEVERKSDFRHTTGNMGKIGSFSREEIDQKQNEQRQMPQVWAKAARLKQLRDQLQYKQQKCVTSDKLTSAKFTVGSELQHLMSLPQSPRVEHEPIFQQSLEIQSKAQPPVYSTLQPNDDQISQTSKLIERVHSRIKPMDSKVFKKSPKNSENHRWLKVAQDASEKQANEHLNLIQQMESAQRRRNLATRTAIQGPRCLSSKSSQRASAQVYPWELRSIQ